MVGVSRLELLTSRSQSARATNCAKPRLGITIPQNMLELKHEKILAIAQAYLVHCGAGYYRSAIFGVMLREY